MTLAEANSVVEAIIDEIESWTDGEQIKFCTTMDDVRRVDCVTADGWRRLLAAIRRETQPKPTKE